MNPMAGSGGEAWQEMVLRSMPLPDWLQRRGPEESVIVSSRVRHARCLTGARFPSTATREELFAVRKRVEKAAEICNPRLSSLSKISEVERDYLIGCRLISTDFPYRDESACLLMDQPRGLCLMVNEEDHLRLQAVTPGFEIEEAEAKAEALLNCLAERLDFAHLGTWGYLAASPQNAGEGRRRSILAHLPGLDRTGQMPRVKTALESRGVVVRGVYGETSHPVGAFFQISMITGTLADFRGACLYLISAEKEARDSISKEMIKLWAWEARTKLVAAAEIETAEAIRSLSLVRWGRSEGLPSLPGTLKEIDKAIALLELQGTPDPRAAARLRAAGIRRILEAAERAS